MDSGIDQQEQAAFFEFVTVGPTLPDGLAKDVMAAVAADQERLSTAWNADPRSAPDGLDQAAAILAKFPVAEARTFAAVLIIIGSNVALASGGGLLGRGPLGIMEQGALAGIAQRFGVSVEDAQQLLRGDAAKG